MFSSRESVALCVVAGVAFGACATAPSSPSRPELSASNTVSASVAAPVTSASSSSMNAAPSASASPAAEPPPSPLVGGLPALKLGAAIAHCTGKGPSASPDCSPKKWAPAGLVIEPHSPAMLWDIDIDEGSTLQLPYGSGAEIYGVVVSGSPSLELWKGQAALMSAWTGFRIPSGGGAISGAGRLVIAVITSDHSPVERLAAPTKAPLVKRPYSTFSFERQTVLPWGKGAYEARIAYEQTGSKPSGDCKKDPTEEGCPIPASLTLLRMSKNAPVAEHTHDKEWELLYVLSGSGVFQRRVNGAPSPKQVYPLSMQAVPPGLPHSWMPDEKNEFLAVQLYVGPGPEQRFHKLSGR